MLTVISTKSSNEFRAGIAITLNVRFIAHNLKLFLLINNLLRNDYRLHFIFVISFGIPTGVLAIVFN